MKRALFVCVAMSAWAPLIAFGQSAQKVPRLCVLTFDPPTARTTKFAEFFDGLRGLGLIDGETIAIDWMSVDGDGSRYPGRAAECLSRDADIIVTTTTPATQAAKAATTTVPIVMLGISDPVANGMVANLARPGGNVTGTALMQSELVTKRLELLSELVPGLSRVLLLVYPADPISGPQIKALEGAARQMNVTLLIHEVRTAGDIPTGYEHGVAMGAQAVLTAVTSIFTVEQASLIELSAKFRLPAVFPGDGAPRVGGLLSYGSTGVQPSTAKIVNRILKGAKPADLPVEQPTRFELVLNLKTAKTLGITIPASILVRADEVIE
jgi:putative ABC transport system substrate-binding protein